MSNWDSSRLVERRTYTQYIEHCDTNTCTKNWQSKKLKKFQSDSVKTTFYYI